MKNAFSICTMLTAALGVIPLESASAASVSPAAGFEQRPALLDIQCMPSDPEAEPRMWFHGRLHLEETPGRHFNTFGILNRIIERNRSVLRTDELPVRGIYENIGGFADFVSLDEERDHGIPGSSIVLISTDSPRDRWPYDSLSYARFRVSEENFGLECRIEPVFGYPARERPFNPIRVASKHVVDGCRDGLNSRAVTFVNGEAWSSRSNRDEDWACDSPRIRYTLSYPGAGPVHLGLQLRLRLLPSAGPGTDTRARRNEMLAATRRCVPRLREIWARYGIRLHVRLDTAEAPRFITPDYEISVHDSYGRPDAVNYHFRGDSFNRAKTCALLCPLSTEGCRQICEPIRQEEYCLNMLHETGHLFGLSDEYPRSSCSEVKQIASETAPWSVMNRHIYGWSNAEFFPRHLRKVLEPICAAE